MSAAPSAIRQSAAEWCYFRDGTDPAAYYRRLKAVGVAGVEMADPSRWQAAKAAGLELVNIGAPGMERGLNRVEDHAEILPKIRESIATAADNGIPTVIVFSGNRGAQSDAAGIAACAKGLAALAPEAERRGITLILEVLNAFDHKDYHCASSRFAFAVVDAVASPKVKSLYDIYHLQRMGEPLLDTILANLGRIAHLHIAGSPKRDFPGPEQEIDYATIVKRVHAAGYRGWWGQEFVPAGRWDPASKADPLDELERAVARFAGFVGGEVRKSGNPEVRKSSITGG
ncbi:MAG: TIM barrel protein [Planctomycetes bacterium]|nr:TIM barrel protein [Planctomycetota bacterium]